MSLSVEQLNQILEKVNSQNVAAPVQEIKTKLPKFDRADIDAWLYAFERATKHLDGDKKIDKLVNSLAGDDLSWFKAVETAQITPLTFDQWKTKFIEKYADSLDVALEKLSKRQQLDFETPEKYVRDVVALCRKVNAMMTTKEILHHLKRGLLEKYRQPIVYMQPKDEKDFQDKLEDLVANQPKTPGVGVESDRNMSEALLTLVKQNAQQAELLLKSKAEPTFVTPDNSWRENGHPQENKKSRCQYCDKKGHDAKSCYQINGRPGSQTPKLPQYPQVPEYPSAFPHYQYPQVPPMPMQMPIGRPMIRPPCSVCFKTGHNVNNCYQVIGFPPRSRNLQGGRQYYNTNGQVSGSNSPHPNAIGRQ